MSWRICPICNNSYFNLWKHFRNEHKNLNLSDSEFLQRYLNLKEIPKCKICNKDCNINYSHYAFNTSCGSSKCANAIRNKDSSINLLKFIHSNEIVFCSKCNRTFKNRQAYVAHKCFKFNCKSTAHIKMHLTAEQKHNLAVKRGLASVKARKFDGKNYYVSKVEIYLYNRLKSLFPNFTILGYDSNFTVSIYKPDIYIKELNLIIEVDGYKFHNLEADIKRDKFICNELNCRIKRLDADYIKYYLTDDELICNIFIELSQPTNYYERIPLNDIGHWKWCPYITGPRLLLTYEH